MTTATTEKHLHKERSQDACSLKADKLLYEQRLIPSVSKVIKIDLTTKATTATIKKVFTEKKRVKTHVCPRKADR
jgi:hypothetical protein